MYVALISSNYIYTHARQRFRISLVFFFSFFSILIVMEVIKFHHSSKPKISSNSFSQGTVAFNLAHNKKTPLNFLCKL